MTELTSSSEACFFGCERPACLLREVGAAVSLAAKWSADVARDPKDVGTIEEAHSTMLIVCPTYNDAMVRVITESRDSEQEE